MTQAENPLSGVSLFHFRRSLPLLAGTLLLLVAFPGAPTALSALAGQSSAAQSATSHARPINPQAWLEQADALFREVSQTTGLPIKAPLQKQVISRKEIEKYLIENLHAEYSPEELRVQEATLQAFGLISPEFNLEKSLIAFYTEQAAGFYDPRRKVMLVADWVEPDMQQVVFAHELTHALQDQNYDLEKFLRAARDNDDATNARQAIAEGYATAAMVQHLIRPAELSSFPSLEPLMEGMVHQRMENFPAFSNAPYFFRLQALFPYAQGMGFIEHGLAQGGWKKLNEVFLHPPTTTKEIFEPGVYYEHKPLPHVSLPRPAILASVPGLRVLTENVMGELGYYALLGQLISENEAKSVAIAWLGDRYILYEGSHEGSTARNARQPYVLVARTRWSSPETALAFFRDYQGILAKKYPTLTPNGRSGADLFIGSVASGEIILTRKGDEVLWAEGISTAQIDVMLSWLRSL